MIARCSRSSIFNPCIENVELEVIDAAISPFIIVLSAVLSVLVNFPSQISQELLQLLEEEVVLQSPIIASVPPAPPATVSHRRHHALCGQEKASWIGPL